MTAVKLTPSNYPFVELTWPIYRDVRAGCARWHSQHTDFDRISRLASLLGQSHPGFENLRPLKAGSLASHPKLPTNPPSSNPNSKSSQNQRFLFFKNRGPHPLGNLFCKQVWNWSPACLYKGHLDELVCLLQC